MRVNHEFIAARRRLYGKHVRGLSSVTAPSHRVCARARARDGPYFSSPKCRRGSFNTDIILLSYSLSATFPDADLSSPRLLYHALFLSLYAPLFSGVPTTFAVYFAR